ncbi:WW domain-binding protein 1-like isoform X1 [Carcharodon carcharias]|uniref:WW domain-binding protein 1-like isoform X1 n=1 Tax=Carcharodon carcharias TaxID=13397 RepID=UPI001B7F6967|nr:WW domain-binding protein 1-like isoform X1 [Carcharodon carcharias]
MDGGWTQSAGPWAEPQQREAGLSPRNLTAANRAPGPRAAPFTQQVRALCPGINNQRYWCETGHCCGETGCCTYFYELWWFWLLWTLLILFSCCCAYRHRRTKLRLQQQQRQQEINLIAYHGACNYPGSPLDQRLLASFKLPAYEEVSAQPSTPPPSYTSIQGIRAELSPSVSSNNCTSCSCSSSSPNSTSVSDTSTSTDPSTPSEPSLSSSDHPAEDVDVAVSQAVLSCSEADEEDETRSRHRRLTGDSGIDVCRCLVHGDDNEDCTEESGNFLHDRQGCVGELLQPADSASLCSCQLPEETLAPIFPV